MTWISYSDLASVANSAPHMDDDGKARWSDADLLRHRAANDDIVLIHLFRWCARNGYRCPVGDNGKGGDSKRWLAGHAPTSWTVRILRDFVRRSVTLTVLHDTKDALTSRGLPTDVIDVSRDHYLFGDKTKDAWGTDLRRWLKGAT